MSFGREIKDFVSSFQSGYKMAQDAEYHKALINYYNRSGKGGYSDDELAKYDPRLATPGFFDRMFGDNGEKLSGAALGEARAAAAAKKAEESGDPDLYQKYSTQYLKLHKMNESVPQKKDDTDTSSAKGKRSELDDQPSAVPVPPVRTAEAETPDPKPEVVADAGATIPPMEDDAVFSATGGMTPALYAYAGGSALDMQGETGGSQQTDDSDNSDDDTEASAIPDKPVQVASNNTQAAATPKASMTDAGEDNGFFKKVVADAQKGVTLGASKLAGDMKGGKSALPTGMNPDTAKSLLLNEGRLSKEELTAIDKAVDPDGMMPDDYKPVARMAAIMNYSKQNPEDASLMAKRLLMTDKFEQQARGNLALQAIQKGDIKSATKLISDAYNSNDYDGNTIDAKVNEDGTVTATIMSHGEPVQTMKADKGQLVQLAANMSNGDEFMQRLAGVVSRGQQFDAGMKAAKKGAGSSSSSADASDAYNTALSGVTKAESARQGAELAVKNASDPEAKKAAQKKLDDAEDALDAAKEKVFSAAGKDKKSGTTTARKRAEEAVSTAIDAAKPPRGAVGAGSSSSASATPSGKSAGQAISDALTTGWDSVKSFFGGGSSPAAPASASAPAAPAAPAPAAPAAPAQPGAVALGGAPAAPQSAIPTAPAAQPQQAAPQAQALKPLPPADLSNAKAAIAKGADRGKVIEYLKSQGFSAEGL